MLDEGIKEKRKYCTPLQALLWLGMKQLASKDYNPLENYSLRSLLVKAWDFSTDDWKDFGKVTDRLNSVEAVTYYMFSRIDYVYYFSNPGDIVTANKVFNSNGGNCCDQASFFVYCLTKNGYYARVIELGEISHCVAFFRDKDGQAYTHNNTLKKLVTYPIIQGPFSSYNEAKRSVIAAWPRKR